MNSIYDSHIQSYLEDLEKFSIFFYGKSIKANMISETLEKKIDTRLSLLADEMLIDMCTNTYRRNDVSIALFRLFLRFLEKKHFLNDFIDLYKSQQCLWNINEPLFENEEARQQAKKAIMKGMQKFNVYMKDKNLHKALDKLHRLCAGIKQTFDYPNPKKIPSITIEYYKKCEFLKELIERKKISKSNQVKKALNFQHYDATTTNFIDCIFYDGQQEYHNKTAVLFTRKAQAALKRPAETPATPLEQLVESRKPTERKAVKKAYQDALHYQSQVSDLAGQGPDSIIMAHCNRRCFLPSLDKEMSFPLAVRKPLLPK
uniref:MADF domain-containing protein n=1 Tax=Glossina brevipalpis TaxID=37001 RepID=A0A1A9W9Y0_9MUSC